MFIKTNNITTYKRKINDTKISLMRHKVSHIAFAFFGILFLLFSAVGIVNGTQETNVIGKTSELPLDTPGSKDLPPETGILKIPKLLHQVWIDFGEGNEVFDKYEPYTARLIELHPGWKYKLWKEDEIIQLIEEHVPFFLQTFRSYDVPIKKHDSARSVILYVHGGVYLDHDSLIFKNLEPMLKTYDFVCAHEPPNIHDKNWHPFATNFLASVPHNEFLLFMLHQMAHASHLHVMEATSPIRLEKSLTQYMAENPEKCNDFKVYNHKFMMPIHPKLLGEYNIKTLMDSYPESFALLLFHNTWVSQYGVICDETKKPTIF